MEKMTAAVWRCSSVCSVPVHGCKTRSCSLRVSGSVMTMQNTSTLSQKKKISLKVQVLSTPESSSSSHLHFDKFQQSGQEPGYRHKRIFRDFIARKALIDEEYWGAAWLRAECHWEDASSNRYTESLKKKFAEQEFNALKRRHGGKLADECTCFIAVKKEEKDVKSRSLKSIVGTLDLTIHQMLQGDTYPWEQVKTSLYLQNNGMDADRYAYISNMCVAKYARRQGIATNILQLAIQAAHSFGAEQIFVHVHRDNKAAQNLYKKAGFQMVDTTKDQTPGEQLLIALELPKISLR